MKKMRITIILMLAATTFALRALPATGFHVAITGNDANPGTQAAPLRTIQRAADLAQPGDTVTVHAGVYRERINPPRGGESDTRRIVYQAAPGERVVITGSEEVKNWEKVQDGVWKATLPNTFFGSFNPFAELIAGDWFDDQGRNHHAGAVYLNGDWLSEAVSREEVMKPITETPLWFASVDTTSTVIWVQFKGVNPNEQQVEVNARQTVFYPDKPGRNFITVRGFTLRNAATPWAPPTVEQIGLIGVNWSKGWIIEDNDISYSRCAGISLGKYGDAKDINEGWAEGYVRTIERALQNGWNKETIGHHMVRNNHISHCGQVGIVGSLGAVFSTVTGNTIHDIHIRQLFSGAEMAGIKFHGAIDVTISGNHVYRNCRGIWLDWMTQGARISGNLCHDNDLHDLAVEANHGPFVVDNNIFLSPKAIEDDSQGVAFAHNLIAGGINLAPGFLDGRKTPFHKAHSTEIVALHDNPSGDNHYDNNLFMRSGSLAIYDEARLPMWMEGNVFFKGAQSSRHESAPINRSASDPGLTLVEKSDGFYLTMTLAAALGSERPSQPVTSARLGKASISGCAFENPDGSPITIGTDYFGKPRNAANPTPGPFEAPGTGTLTMKVWPLTVARKALLTALPVRADDLAAQVTTPADFWVRDQPGRITHACGGKEPLVLCMQGRKVVMQVQSDRTNGFSYTARFFNLQKEVEKKKALFVAGRESTPQVRVNGQPWKSEFPSSVTFDGMLTLTYPEAGGVVVTRTVYPSMTKALVIEEWQVRNATGKQVAVMVAPGRSVNPVGEDISIVWSCPEVKTAEVEAGGVLSFSTCVQAGLAAEPDLAVNVAAERGARLALAEAAWRGPGRLETPEPLLDHAFALQKLHVLESPIETIKGVITHNGSLTYSPGIWANDPVEYSSPLFPFFGDPELNKASLNMYRVWLDYCRQHGADTIPGCFWQPTLQVGQWERGDDAMILYGLSKFLLFQGDKAAAEEMWPLIEMCAASVLKHTTSDGIVASESDEMEGRYPTGNANLSTSSLAYGGYRLAAHLGRSLGKPQAGEFDKCADHLRKSIESYFGAEIEGFKTYRYYKENTVLRGWILLPPAMGITERQDGTLDAMVSDQLWPTRMQGGDILAASDRRETEWGRETYYALRVMFKAGRTEQAIDLTLRVVKAQIFGANGPYPDEDAIDMLCPGSLYPRVFTEGLFGIVPTGLNSFECTPWLPKGWPRMALRDVRAFGQSWDLVVERAGDQQKVTVLSGGKTLMTGWGPAGKTYALTFLNGKHETQKQ